MASIAAQALLADLVTKHGEKAVRTGINMAVRGTRRVIRNRRTGRQNQAKQSSGKMVSAPAAKGRVQRNQRNRDALRVSQAKGANRISNDEFFTNVRGYANGSVKVYRFQMDCIPSRRLSELAKLHKNFQVTKAVFTYKSSSSTQKEGKVYMGIVYDADFSPPSRPDLSTFTSLGDNSNSPVWSDVKLSVNPKNFTRPAPAKYAVTSEGELAIPFSLIVMTNGYSGTDGDICGHISLDYEVAFFGVDPNPAPTCATLHAEFTSSSDYKFDDAVLGSTSSSPNHYGSIGVVDTFEDVSGCIFDVSRNSSETSSIRFNRGGTWKVWHRINGSSPVIDVDGHTITDENGTDVSSKAFKTFDTDGTVDGSLASHAGSQTGYGWQQLYIEVQSGDILKFDSLVSGSGTDFLLEVSPWNSKIKPIIV